MSVSGALFYGVKLLDVSKNLVSRLSSVEVYDFVTAWAKEFDDEFYKVLTASDATTLTEITTQNFKFVRGLIKAEGANKKVVFDALVNLVKESNAMHISKRKEKQKSQKTEKNKKSLHPCHKNDNGTKTKLRGTTQIAAKAAPLKPL